MSSDIYVCRILTYTGTFQPIFLKILDMKFHEHPSGLKLSNIRFSLLFCEGG